MPRTAEGPLPEGLRYQPGFVAPDEQDALLAHLREVRFDAVVMHGVVARRRTAHYGWLYGYSSWQIEPGPAIPSWLHPLRARVARLIDATAESLEEVLLSEYPAGAGIGWHRDAPMFGPAVVGISLLAPCRMRFQRGKPGARETASLVLEPRSAYVLAGEARTQWQHYIPACKELRYSITFRTLKRSSAAAAGARPA